MKHSLLVSHERRPRVPHARVLPLLPSRAHLLQRGEDPAALLVDVAAAVGVAHKHLKLLQGIGGVAT